MHGAELVHPALLPHWGSWHHSAKRRLLRVLLLLELVGPARGELGLRRSACGGAWGKAKSRFEFERVCECGGRAVTAMS